MRKSSSNQLSRPTGPQQRADTKFTLTVCPPGSALMKAYHIDRLVLTHLSYGGEPLQDMHGNRVGVIEYAADKQQEKQTLQADMSGTTTEQSVHCSYLVTYEDGTQTFHAPAINLQGRQLDLASIDFGVLHVSLNGAQLPWGVLSYVAVELRYGDWQARVALREDDAPLVISKPLGHAMTEHMSYRLTLHFIAGAPITGESIDVALEHGHADIALTSPLGSDTAAITYTLDSEVNQARLRLEYVFRSKRQDQLFHKLIELDRAKQTCSATWRVPVNTDLPGSLRVVKARIDGNEPEDLSGATLDSVETAATIAVCRQQFKVL